MTLVMFNMHVLIECCDAWRLAAHTAGRVRLQIGRQGAIITNAAVFEYRAVQAIRPAAADWPETFVSLLVSRLDYLSSQLDLQGCDVKKLLTGLVRCVSSATLIQRRTKNKRNK